MRHLRTSVLVAMVPLFGAVAWRPPANLTRQSQPLDATRIVREEYDFALPSLLGGSLRHILVFDTTVGSRRLLVQSEILNFRGGQRGTRAVWLDPGTLNVIREQYSGPDAELDAVCDTAIARRAGIAGAVLTRPALLSALTAVVPTRAAGRRIALWRGQCNRVTSVDTVEVGISLDLAANAWRVVLGGETYVIADGTWKPIAVERAVLDGGTSIERRRE